MLQLRLQKLRPYIRSLQKYLQHIFFTCIYHVTHDKLKIRHVFLYHVIKIQEPQTQTQNSRERVP